MKRKLLIYIVLTVQIVILSPKLILRESVESASINAVALNSQFPLKIRQTALIESENLKITFLSVTEDSRCIPYRRGEKVVCKWEGQVTIVINVFKDNKNLGNFSLTSRGGLNESSVINSDRYSVQLIKINYMPLSIRDLRLADYIVTLLVKQDGSKKIQ